MSLNIWTNPPMFQKHKEPLDYAIYLKPQWMGDDEEEISRVFKLVSSLGSKCSDVEIAELAVHIKNIMTNHTSVFLCFYVQDGLRYVWVE